MAITDPTWNISIQQVQIFLKAVELNNFSQAAAYFSFTPSMVSKTISYMEDELGITLFYRGHHEMTPTPAAMLLSSELRQFVSSFTLSVKKARAIQEGKSRRILFGFVDSSAKIDALIRDAIRSYSASGNVTIAAEKHDMHRLAELLRHGMLDLIQTSAFEIPYLDEHQLPWEKVFDSEVIAYVPRTNPLFTRDSLSFADLSKQSLVSLDALMHPYYHKWLYELCGKYGFVPRIADTFRTVRSLLFALKLHDAIFIGDTVTEDWIDAELKGFPLPEKSFSLIACRKGADRTIVDFKEYIKGRYQKPAP